MRTLTVTDPTYDRLTLLARAWETTPSDAVTRMLDEFQREGDRPSQGDHPDDVLGIVVNYAGEQVEGRFIPKTGRVEVTTGPLAGRAFKSPSGAASAVVKTLNPAVHPNRNGWTFWQLRADGRFLQDVRSPR